MSSFRRSLVSSLCSPALPSSPALLTGVVLFSAALSACGTDDGGGSTGGPTTGVGSTTATASSVTGTGGNATTGSGTTGSSASASTTSGAVNTTTGTSTTSGTDTSTGGTTSSTTGTGTTGGTGEAPGMLSETGLFTARVDGELVLAEGVREFQPRYALWSDAAAKHRYIYLPPGTQIDTENVDHWILPAGTKLWKSFSVGEQLVETRLIERIGDGENDWRFSTYVWESADATDAGKVAYIDQWKDAAETTHDVPSGAMCERCHNGLRERVLGFSALQLNHDLGGLNLATLESEGLLTTDIPLDVEKPMPGEDEQTQNALGYLHANCGNCHNDDPGIPVESVPAPQLLLRVRVADQDLEDTDTYKTAINQPTTASAELGLEWRILGGDPSAEPIPSAVTYRMHKRGIEDQMPPIGTEVIDPDGYEVIRAWIESLDPPEE